VKFYGEIRLFLKINEINIEIDEDIKLIDFLKKIELILKKEFIHKLVKDNMEITAGTIILINGKNIYHLDMLNSIVKDNDVVALFPPGAGG
jgi:molybdopterin synthase sulfur carrier subunit